MSTPLKVLLYVVFNAIGYYAAVLAAVLLAIAQLYPTSDSLDVMKHINTIIVGGATWVWLACAVTSIGVFLGGGPKRIFLLALPVLLPTFYVICAVLWFKMHTA